MTLDGVLRAPCGGSHPVSHRSGRPLVCSEWYWVRHTAVTWPTGMPSCCRRIEAPRPASKTWVLPPACTSVLGPKRSGLGSGPLVPRRVTVIVASWLDAGPVAIARQTRAHRTARTRAIHALPLQTITSWDRLDIEIAAIRQRGLAYDRDENSTGISAVSVIVRGASGEMAAISIRVPTQRFELGECELASELVRHTAVLQQDLKRQPG